MQTCKYAQMALNKIRANVVEEEEEEEERIIIIIIMKGWSVLYWGNSCLSKYRSRSTHL